MGRDAFSQYHPLTNFLFFVGAIGFCVVFQHPAYLAVGIGGAVVYYLLLHGRVGLHRLMGMLPVFLVVSGLNPLFNHYGSRALFTVFGKPYTLEALYYGVALGAMFVGMLLWFGCYSAVLTSDKFVCLFGSLIPSLSLLLVMILRMIPNMTRRAGEIAAARKCIGKGLGEGATNREKISGGLKQLSALTDWALEGSILTADSMRSRGYGSAKRTSFQIYHLCWRDWVLMALMGVLAALVIGLGGTQASYTPKLWIPQPGWGLVCYGVYVLIPAAVHLQEELKWRIFVSRI